MADGAADWIMLASDLLHAEIDPVGAQLSVLRDGAARDLLWTGDPAQWSGRAPILFPIVGELAGGAYRLGGASHPMRRHGFARGKRFTVAQSGATTALFTLHEDAESLAAFPFRFALSIRFEAVGAALAMTATVRNSGDRELPASVGFHPGLRWPLPFGGTRAAHYLEFDVAEPAAVRRLDKAGLLRPERLPTPVVDRRLTLDDALFREDVLIFDDLRSRSLTYGAAGPRVRIEFPDARYLGVWSKPGAGFVCIEPWQGIADPAGYSGDFRDKPGVHRLAPGAEFSLSMRITLPHAQG